MLEFLYTLSPSVILNYCTLATIGAYMGIAGGLFNCTTSIKNKLIAFGIWIFSNFILGYWAYSTGEINLGIMYTIFMGTSGYGFYSHWKELKPKKTQ